MSEDVVKIPTQLPVSENVISPPEEVPVTPPFVSPDLQSGQKLPEVPHVQTETRKYYKLDQVVEPLVKAVPEATEAVKSLGRIVASSDKLTFSWTGLPIIQGEKDNTSDAINFAPREVVLGSRPAEEDVSYHNSEIAEVTTIATGKLQELANGGSLELDGDPFDYNSGNPKPQPSYEAERKALFTIMRGLSQSERSRVLEGVAGSGKTEFNTYLSQADINKVLAKNKNADLPPKRLHKGWVSARVTDTGIVNPEGKILILTRGIKVVKDEVNPLKPIANEVLTASWRTPEEIAKHLDKLSSADQDINTFQSKYKPAQQVQF